MSPQQKIAQLKMKMETLPIEVDLKVENQENRMVAFSNHINTVKFYHEKDNKKDE